MTTDTETSEPGPARGSGCTEASEAILGASETVHLIFDGSATTSCCWRPPFELCRTDRLTVDISKATCTGTDNDPLTETYPGSGIYE